jgi:hypothetical protein
MSIEEDFDPQTAAHMRDELAKFRDKCHYDESRKRIVYLNDHFAMEAYLTIQREEIERHKWIESEKYHRDMGKDAMADWVRRFSEKFSSYWRRTHAYIPPKSSSEKGGAAG